ncbi:MULTISPECIES: hypothetical protein [Streptomyces]|uniref:Uncharacterized protein n=1 Tax=Streptomyces griseorubens TaxID=66897 RepID=A0ABR4T4W1_9ACTN|nr:hypothetical protein DJ64_31815 [Streptomyces griseorubens]
MPEAPRRTTQDTWIPNGPDAPAPGPASADPGHEAATLDHKTEAGRRAEPSAARGGADSTVGFGQTDATRDPGSAGTDGPPVAAHPRTGDRTPAGTPATADGTSAVPGPSPTGTHTPGSAGTGSHAPGLDGTGSHAPGSAGTGTHTPGASGTGTDAPGLAGTGTHTSGTAGIGTHTPGTADTGTHTSGSGGTGTHAPGSSGTGTHAPGSAGAGADTHATTPGPDGTSGHPGSRLLGDDTCGRLSAQLRQAVAGFVDRPRDAVEEADLVLHEITERLNDALTERRRTLTRNWKEPASGDPGKGDAAPATDTEQLRLALRDYRELAERLLGV